MGLPYYLILSLRESQSVIRFWCERTKDRRFGANPSVPFSAIPVFSGKDKLRIQVFASCYLKRLAEMAALAA